MKKHKKKIIIGLGIIILAISSITIIAITKSNDTNNEEDYKDNITQDFVTEVNKYSEDKYTLDDMKKLSINEILNLEEITESNNGKKMEYTQDYCNLSGDYYLNALKNGENNLKSLSCYYYSNENTMYFKNNFKKIEESYKLTQEAWGYNSNIEFAQDMGKSLSGINNTYFKILLILNCPPSYIYLYFMDNSPLGLFELNSIDDIKIYKKDDKDIPKDITFKKDEVEKGIISYKIQTYNKKQSIDEVPSDLESWTIIYHINNKGDITFTNNTFDILNNEKESSNITTSARDWAFEN